MPFGVFHEHCSSHRCRRASLRVYRILYSDRKEKFMKVDQIERGERETAAKMGENRSTRNCPEFFAKVVCEFSIHRNHIFSILPNQPSFEMNCISMWWRMKMGDESPAHREPSNRNLSIQFNNSDRRFLFASNRRGKHFEPKSKMRNRKWSHGK